jgi:hypothetical protein
MLGEQAADQPVERIARCAQPKLRGMRLSFDIC